MDKTTGGKLNLNVIGMGPGDPELITVKAVNALINSDFIFYPDVSGGKNKAAYDIAKAAVRIATGHELEEERFLPLKVEMKRSSGRNKDLYAENAAKIAEKLKEGDCSYVTIGDPMFYSTYWGLHDAIENIIDKKNKHFAAAEENKGLKTGNEIENGRRGFKINIINGVSSFHYSFGLIGEPYIVKNSPVLITVPVKKDLREIEDEIRFIAGKSQKPRSIVFMKAGGYVKDILSAFEGVCGKVCPRNNPKLYLIEKSKLIDKFWEKKEKDFDYFSVLVGVFL